MKHLFLVLLPALVIGSNALALTFSGDCKIGQFGQEVTFGSFQLDMDDLNHTHTDMRFKFPGGNTSYVATAEVLHRNEVYLYYSRFDGPKLVNRGASGGNAVGSKLVFFDQFKLENTIGQLICSGTIDE